MKLEMSISSELKVFNRFFNNDLGQKSTFTEPEHK